MFCNNSNILNIIFLVKTLLKIMGILVPVLMIFLITIDFFKSISSGEDDKDKVIKLGVNRLFYGSLFFFIPTIVNLFLGVIATTVEVEKDHFLACYESATADNINFLKAQEATLKKAKINERKMLKEKQDEYRNSFNASRSELEKQRRQEIEKLEKERKERLQRENEMGSSNNEKLGELINGTAKTYKDIVWDPNDVTKISNIRSEQLMALLKSYDGKLGKLVPYVDGLVTIEQKYKVNIFFLIGIQILESGWYQSDLAIYCNNFGGIKESDGSSTCSVDSDFRYYATPTAFFQNQANLLSESYLTPGAPYYKGKTIRSVNLSYCPPGDGGCDNWASSVKEIADDLFDSLKQVM